MGHHLQVSKHVRLAPCRRKEVRLITTAYRWLIGTGSGYEAHEIIELVADAPRECKNFAGWMSSSGGVFEDAMPAWRTSRRCPAMPSVLLPENRLIMASPTARS